MAGQSGVIRPARPINRRLDQLAAGAAATGGVAGVGTVALIDAAVQPCAGFRALFSPFRPGSSGCMNGEFVGYRVAERSAPRYR